MSDNYVDFPVTEEVAKGAAPLPLHEAASGGEGHWPACFKHTESGWVYRVELPEDQIDKTLVQAALENPEPRKPRVTPDERIDALEAENTSLRDAVDTLVLDALTNGGTA